MQNKKKRLLKTLSETTGQWWSSMQLAELLQVSQRTILRYMSELKEEEEQGGFRLDSMKGKGYLFEVTDPRKLQKYMQDDENVQIILLKILLEHTCKLDDLAEMFNYSRSGMTGILSEVTEEVERHGLKLLSKPYVGFIVHGNEICIRNYIYQLLEKQELEEAEMILSFPQERAEEVGRRIGKYLERRHVQRKKENEEFFLKYLGIQLRRIQLNQTICTGFLAELENEKHFQEDLKVAEQILKFCGIEPPGTANYEIEVVYLTLVYRQAFWQNGFVDPIDEKNLGFYQRIVEASLKRILQNYNMNLMGDEVLVNGLILHIASSYRKYLLGMETENSFHNTILEHYPTAYYFAMEVAEEISNYTKLPLGKYEVSFLGMHFASYLERNLKSHSFQVAIICMSGLGTAQLLRSRLENYYPQLEITGVYALDEWERDSKEVDFLISTVPLTEKTAKGRAWVQVSPLLTVEEQVSIEKLFKRLGRTKKWEKGGVPKYFRYLKGQLKKQEIIEQVCDEYIGTGMISEEEKEGILEREQLVSTEILEGVAMPHGLIQKDSFLTFIMLEYPVMWGRTRVRLVILGCFKQGDERMKEELEHLFGMFLEEETRTDLLSCETPLQLEERINEYYTK